MVLHERETKQRVVVHTAILRIAEPTPKLSYRLELNCRCVCQVDAQPRNMRSIAVLSFQSFDWPR